MYKKKKDRKMLYAWIVIVLLIAGFVAVFFVIKKKQADEAETETELPKYEALLYKTGDSTVEFDESWLKEDTEDTTVMNIEADTLVDLLITPKEGRVIESAEVMDHQFAKINSLLAETSSKAMRLSFSMPDRDVIIQIHLADQEKEAQTEPETQPQTQTEHVTEPESETEPQTAPPVETSPYGLTLHGLTADIIASYNGMFDDQKFLTQLGDALHPDSARSDYRRVTDVTFSTEAYTGAQDADKVYHYIYFNEDPQWKVLATYYMAEDSYVFTDATEQTEPQTAPPITTGNNTGTGNTGSMGSTTGTSGGSYSTSSGGSYNKPAGSTSQTTVTTSFDIMSVSTTFLAYVGGEETFYEKAFDYVLESGLTGAITGTMSSYEIKPEKKRATAEIALSTGKVIRVKYNKEKDSFKFSGLD